MFNSLYPHLKYYDSQIMLLFLYIIFELSAFCATCYLPSDKSTRTHLKNVYACVAVEIVCAALGAAINIFLKSSVSVTENLIILLEARSNESVN